MYDVVELDVLPEDAQDRIDVVTLDEHWQWTGAQATSGYSGRYKHNTARRYLYEFFYGEIPKDDILVPLCGVPYCVRPDHMVQKNAAARQEWFRENVGNTGGRRSKITAELVAKVLELRAKGLGYPRIGKALGISQGTARKIVLLQATGQAAIIEESTESAPTQETLE